MSSVAETPQAARAARTARRGPRARRPALLDGAVWILALGVLLAGIVALNVIVLQLTVQLDDLGHERAQLKADISHLESQLSSAGANYRIEREAQEQLGLVEADPATTTYLSVLEDR
ncbi:MAG TPA: cell division protein FtsL [Gaiellaceae bacterium]